ncbi:SDR family oxidoreductase [Acetobacter fabarum]|uniref:SDR family oxidoreductase n=1 Tax=Acetobacter fabarum TaxID=483199 RepID=UPI00312B9535
MTNRDQNNTTRVALVTGGAKRIGAVLSQNLARNGWKVAIQYNHSEQEALELVNSLTSMGYDCFAIHADFNNREDVQNLIPAVIKHYGAIDVLVNNASNFEYDNIDSLTFESFDKHMEPNLTAPLFLSRDFARAPGNIDDRCIVNILDHKVKSLNPDFLSYTISKAALLCVTQVLSMAFKSKIRVNAIAPGLTLRSGKQTDEGFERAWRATPLGRSSTPEEISACLTLILSASSMVGQVIYLDGGESLINRVRDIAFDTTVV